jgi:pyrroloquinoline quinone biosynthesis protein B
MSNETIRIEVIVLGIAQDGGIPQIGCTRPCCKGSKVHYNVSSIALTIQSESDSDHVDNEVILFDCSPDFREQYRTLQAHFGGKEFRLKICLTHAHMGHYLGLAFLGREALNADRVQVYCAERMAKFLRDNGPFSQLVALGNIELNVIEFDGGEVQPMNSLTNVDCGNDAVHVRCTQVKHRGEFSETLAFHVCRRHGDVSLFYVPDIDAWGAKHVDALVRQSNYALVDATFCSASELERVADVPHPFVSESIARFGGTAASHIYFTHLNHTNPLLHSPELATDAGCHVLEQGQLFSL